MIFNSILIFICSMAVIYIFHLKRSLRKIVSDIREKAIEDTNTLLVTSSYTKEVCSIVQVFNETWQQSRKQEIEIERRNKQLQKAIVNISHDLRTPLTSALGYLEIIDSYDVSPEKKKAYEEIVILKLTELKKLIEDLFVFTKAVSGKESITWELLDVNQVFEQSVLSYYHDFVEQNRVIHMQGNKKVKMLSNQRLLRRIFDNIMINALRHSHSDVDITVTITDSLTYTFKNTLTKKIQVDRIFDEFYTADVSRTNQQTGLGLAIVKEFVEQLGGEVQVKQEGNQLYIILSWPLDNNE